MICSVCKKLAHPTDAGFADGPIVHRNCEPDRTPGRCNCEKWRDIAKAGQGSIVWGCPTHGAQRHPASPVPLAPRHDDRVLIGSEQ